MKKVFIHLVLLPQAKLISLCRFFIIILQDVTSSEQKIKNITSHYLKNLARKRRSAAEKQCPPREFITETVEQRDGQVGATGEMARWATDDMVRRATDDMVRGLTDEVVRVGNR